MESVVAPRRILAVDDSVVNLRLLEAVLGRAGYEVATTPRATETLNLALNWSPDLILLDVMMPEVSGLELLGLLKSHPQTHDLPVVMVTARTRGDDVREALDAGAFDYIKKPLDEIETLARIRSALRFHASQSRLLELATHDSLTGLYNHKLLLELLSRELGLAQRQRTSVSFCMVDLDHFKLLNDEFGHQAGDEVLRRVASVLEHEVRKTDPVGRYGGEEFGIVLVGCPASSARELCERLRSSIEQLPLFWNGQGLRVTASLGLATVGPEDDADPEALVKRADEALYRAKELGRNRLVLA